MILSNAEVDEIERHASWFGDVGCLIESHRALASIVQELVNIRYGEMTLNSRLKELIDREKRE